jgi:hypothetical protein
VNLNDWIYFFVHAFRYEAKTMHPVEAKFLGDFFKEQTLAKPCQVEAIIFTNPYRLALMFFLDQSKTDLQIRIRRAERLEVEKLVSTLQNKYSALKINPSGLSRLFERCINCHEGIIYGIDFIRDVLIVYFTHDPRKKLSPVPTVLNCSKPQDVAEMAFRLNIDHSSSYYPFKDS